MGRPTRNVTCLDALRRAFFENAVRLGETGAEARVVTAEAIAAASGLDIRRAAVSARQTPKTAAERIQGRS